MWMDLFRAVCLLLVLEGILPFLYPGRWRKLVASLGEISDSTIRLMGLISMLIGLALLFLGT